MKKDSSIETLRGIAIILMVAGHVVGDNPTTGLKVAEDSILKMVFNAFLFIRMPLFSAISGYIYASHSIKLHQNVKPFLQRKIVRLLIPFLSASTIFYLFKRIIPEINNSAPELQNIWTIYLISWYHFWFIQAVFLAFVVISIIDHYNLLSTVWKWSILISSIFLVFTFINTSIPTFFSINKFFFLFPFFLLGLGLNRFKDKLLAFKFQKVLLVVFIFVFSLQQYYNLNGLALHNLEHKLLLISVGVSGITSLIYLQPNNKLLASLGFYSFGIYLYHVFGTAGSRMILKSFFKIENDYILFFIGLMAGVLLPVLMQLTLQRISIFNLLLFGQHSAKRSETKEQYRSYKIEVPTISN